MKLTKVLLMGIGVAVIAFASCKKSSSGASTQSNLEGSWKATYQANDLNGNGVLDASEKYVDTSDANNIFTFNANGTFAIAISGTTVDQQNWTLINSNTYIKLLDTTAGSTPDYLHIDALSSTAMTLKDTTGGTTSWIIFAKQ